MNREREKKTQGSRNDSKELKGREYGRTSERVMAGGRGASSSCQDRGRTRVGKKGREIEQCNLWDPAVCKGEWYVEADACACVSTRSASRWRVKELASASWAAVCLRLGGMDFCCDSPQGRRGPPGLLAPPLGWGSASETQLDELWLKAWISHQQPIYNWGDTAT